MIYTNKRIFRKITLPVALNEQIKGLNLTKIQLNKCYHLLYLLTVNPSRVRSTFYDWQPLATAYLTQMLGSKYSTYVDALGEADIIQCDNIFHKGKAYLYRINPSISFSGDQATIVFNYKSKVPLKKHKADITYTSDFKAYLSTLSIDYDKLYQVTDNYVSNITLDDYTVNYEINFDKAEGVDIIHLDGNIESTYMNKQQAMTYAANNTYDVIEDGKEFKIMDADKFIELKKDYVRAYFINCIEALKDDCTIYANRNLTNERLDTNFTSMPSILLDVIYGDNDIVEIDQANSQPALLAYKMELDSLEGVDVALFQKLAYEGSFYEYMATEIGVSRKRAKKMMFEVLFSSAAANSSNKKVFRDCFPTVWEYIKDYKTTNGKNNFSVMLQKLESSLFIDKIFAALTKLNIPLLTKHDSVACSKEDYPTVIEFINKIYTEINFKGTLKVKEPIKYAA